MINDTDIVNLEKELEKLSFLYQQEDVIETNEPLVAMARHIIVSRSRRMFFINIKVQCSSDESWRL